MRQCARIALLSTLVASGSVLADPYDIRLLKLDNPNPGGPNYDPRANARFRAFAREFGAAITSVTLTPPETLGHAAFSVNAELSVVNFSQATEDGDLSEGVILPTQRLGTESAGVDGALLIPSIHVRKGLPWSFELGGRVGWIEKSRMAIASGEFKWALNEGFTFLPDVGVRGHVTRLFNTRDFELTAGGVDLSVGKQFAIGGMVTLTPYAGWNLVWVGASSNSVDFNPGLSSAEAACGAGWDPSRVCDANAQFATTGVYDEVSLGSNSHNRFYAGVRFIGGALQLGAEYSLSQLPRIAVPTADGASTEEQQLPNVTALNVTLGLDF